MKTLKQYAIFAFLSILSILQIFYLYSKNTNFISFYPKWSVFINNQKVYISTNQGFFAQIETIDTQNKIDIKKQPNSLIIKKNNSKTINKDFELIIKYCNNCFVIDYNHNIVFTEKDPKEDIILKKKIISNNYSIENKNIVDLTKNNLKLAIFNAFSEEIIKFEKNTATVYIDDLKKEIRFKISNSNSQKFTFL